MLLEARAELEVGPRIIMHLEIAVDLGPEFPCPSRRCSDRRKSAESDRDAAGLGVVLIWLPRLKLGPLPTPFSW